ncbi:MAG: RelA/SpoT domain-containing protein [Bdellovibrionales bacterium]|jgi:putative GTP pyrophosphokinase|nr:RelA/SpoT domain-containing protein [Bdellovibrionales bacterium]
MKSVELIHSKSQIDRAGELLKNIKSTSDDVTHALEILSNWRDIHAMPLDTFAKVLRVRALKISKEAIVAQRLKRTPSILLKLLNHKTMRLSAMQDIGGLRAILETSEKVYDLLNLYKKSKSKHSLTSLDDYINEPKSDGYRGIHLVFKLKREPSLFLEIQLRSQLQHIWATGVEVFGTLKNSSFKSGQGNQKWLEFFALLSSVFAIKEGLPKVKKHRDNSKAELVVQLQNLITELHVIHNLNVYTAVYKTLTSKNIKGRKGHYSLILLNSRESTVSIKTFSAHLFDIAAKEYLNLETNHFNDKQINIVLVNTGDLKKLAESYPNYFMDTKTLVKILSLIMLGEFV